MRATAVARIPVLLLLALFLVVGGVRYKVYVDGVGGGDVGPGGVNLCLEEDPVEQQELIEEPAVELVNTCVRMSFCTGFGVDSMTQRVCAPID